ncbi:MAG: amidase domain-containing protein [Oscillospiraceae bacterium]|nr:amidase domain-containing protein [Oscillospiraceae bacterium]
MLSEYGVQYTDYEIDIQVIDSEFTDNTANLIIEENGKLYYDQITGEEPEFTAWKAVRNFEFERNGSTWQFVSQQLVGDGPVPSNEPVGVTEDEMRASLTKIHNIANTSDNIAALIDEQPAATNSTTFIRQNAVDYAVEWWNSRNSDYRDFGSNDCTNFVSQAMRAGGWTDVTGLYTNAKAWWYTSSNQSTSWINVIYCMISHLYIADEPQ